MAETKWQQPAASGPPPQQQPASPRGSQPQKAGYLTKLGKNIKTWKKRWFQMESGGVLCYYKDASYVTGKPLGSIVVSGCAIEPQPPSVIGRQFAFSIIPPVPGERVYNIFADSSRDLQEWVDVLNEVANKPSSRRSRGASTIAQHKTNATVQQTTSSDSLYSTSLPVRIQSHGPIGSRESQNAQMKGKAALLERRQKRMHTNSVTSSESCYSDDSDFEGEDTSEDTSSTVVFKCDMGDEEAQPPPRERKDTLQGGALFRMSGVITQASVILLDPKQMNNICADCHQPNPEFVSATLGMAYCSDCADVHSLLPESISVIKKASKESFSKNELDRLRESGNDGGNKIWEAHLPPDFDRTKELKGRQERMEFIRNKYLNKLYANTSSSGTSESLEDLKRQVERLQQEIAEKSRTILDLRKQAEKVSEAPKAQEDTSLIEKLKLQLREEHEKRVEAEEARLIAEENEASTNQKYLEEKKKRKELSHSAFVLQENVKNVYDGLMRMTSQMMDGGSIDLDPAEQAASNFTDSFVEQNPMTERVADDVHIRSNTEEGEESLIFEKISFK